MDRHYKLKCQVCDAEYDDDGFVLECMHEHEASLLKTQYSSIDFDYKEYESGLYRYRNWLPILYTFPAAGGTITYQSERLGRITGLPNLWIAFNGYWPEKGARLETASFKELEAFSVLSRIPEKRSSIIVVSSAGNTAAAFAHICSQNNLPVLIVIPASGLRRMQFAEPLNPCVRIVSICGSADYYDAIALAEHVSRLKGFFPEGGVKNVARRDGLGTTLLNAVETIGQLPDYYFQAIGSGTGGIAVFEAAKRLIKDGRFGQNVPQLMLSQNLPFVPIYLSWKSRQRQLIQMNRDDGKKLIQQTMATVLSNQAPPYSIRGGVFDILDQSRGDMLTADGSEVRYAMKLFEESEAIDIDPAAGVAFATVIKAAMYEQIDRKALVLLHITGGGWNRLWLDNKPILAKPTLQIEEHEISTEKTLDKVVKLFM